MGGGLGRVTKHPEYHLSDGSVSFLIDNTHYRIHKSFFERESEVFRDLFASAAEDDVESDTGVKAYKLDVKSHEFEQFLSVWYDRDYCCHGRPKENWITVLRLANRWQFHKVKELAVRELEALRLSPAERVAIYNEHGVDDDHLFDSYVELCKSPTVPTHEEARFIEMEVLVNILQAREDAQHKAYKLRHESPTSAGLEDDTLREIVSRFFKTGLDPRSNGTSMGSGVQASNLNLNGGQAQGRGAETITLGNPQLRDKKESREQQAETNGTHGTTENHRAGEYKKTMEAMQEKEREEKEKREKETPAKEEKEKADKAKQEARDKGKNVDKRNRPWTPLRKI